MSTVAVPRSGRHALLEPLRSPRAWRIALVVGTLINGGAIDEPGERTRALFESRDAWFLLSHAPGPSETLNVHLTARGGGSQAEADVA